MFDVSVILIYDFCSFYYFKSESSNFFRSWDVKLSYPVDITIDKFSHTPDGKGHFISSPQLSFTDEGGLVFFMCIFL